jgi:hypothetical protein
MYVFAIIIINCCAIDVRVLSVGGANGRAVGVPTWVKSLSDKFIFITI